MSQHLSFSAAIRRDGSIDDLRIERADGNTAERVSGSVESGGPVMSLRSIVCRLTFVLVASSILLASSCPSASPVDVPKLIDIQGYGKLWKATATSPDTFGFSVRPAAICQTGTTNCPARYADTAFIDFRIPARTTFEVIADGRTLTEVGQAAPVGDYQYRRVALDDGSGATVAWRIAVSVPSMVGNPPAPREWCGPTRFTVEIVNLSANATPPRSAPLTVLLHWGMCPVTGGPMFWASTGKQGTPKQTSPPPPVGECPGGSADQSFDVCERCGTSGLSVEKTFWGCNLNDSISRMGQPGCVSVARSGLSCP